MGVSASSLLDETKSGYIRGEAEAELKAFEPYYRKQFFAARFSEVEEELQQNRESVARLLQQKEAPEEAEVLYEDAVLYFDDSRKWRERYVVVRANYCLECHDGLESFIKGVPPIQKLLPTGGAAVTSEDAYMALVDKCFPDETGVKEDLAPPLSAMPGPFPVYLRLLYRRDSYFCFRLQEKQEAFISILSDCIRHQNQDFLKKSSSEVKAFLRAVQLYRQDGGRSQAWDMMIGSDVRVMANLVMERLLPSLEKDLLPRLKAKKTERRRVWLATVEAAYILVQEQLLTCLADLKDDCRAALRQQEVPLRSDMDQILESRRRLEREVRGGVSAAAEKICSESVQPFLSSALDQMMQPISSGFQEGRRLSENMMQQVCQEVQQGATNEQLKQALSRMARPNLLSCYQKIAALEEKLRPLQERFGPCSLTGVVHGAQIDLQQLMENAAHTFQLLFYKAVQDHPDNAAAAVHKVTHRVLKQFDYDSSSVRKKTIQEALVATTLPFIKRSLQDTCTLDLKGLEQTVDSDHLAFIPVENIYERVLLQTLDDKVTKVVKEAANLKKYDLMTDSRDPLNPSSRSSLSGSTPGSPAMAPANTASTQGSPASAPGSPASMPGSPAMPPANTASAPGSPASTPGSPTMAPASTAAVTGTPSAAPVAPGSPAISGGSENSDSPAAAMVATSPNLMAPGSPVESPPSPLRVANGLSSSPGEGGGHTEPLANLAVCTAESPETETQEEAGCLLRQEVASDVKAEEQQEDDARRRSQEVSEGETRKEDQDGRPGEDMHPEPAGAECSGSQPDTSPEVESAAPPGGETSADQQSGDCVSAPNSLAVSVGSESPPSNPDTDEDGSTAAEPLEQEVTCESRVSGEEKEEAAGVQVVGVEEKADGGDGEAPPLDSVQGIRDLVTEVFEVEELVPLIPSQE